MCQFYIVLNSWRIVWSSIDQCFWCETKEDKSTTLGGLVQGLRSCGLGQWRRWGRLGELGGVDLGVRFHVAELKGGAAVDPGYGPAKGHLDAGDVAIVSVVNLGGNAADGHVGVTHLANQQVGLLVEV